MTQEKINWKVQKPKAESIHLSKLWTDPTGKLNPARTVNGQMDGVTVIDNRDIPGMARDIYIRGGIQRPLVILRGSKLAPEKGDKDILVCGTRRKEGAEYCNALGALKLTEMWGDAELAQKTIESFKAIPVLVYTSSGNDTDDLDFILAMGNDQDSKPYSVSGLFNAVMLMQANGKTFMEIGQVYGEQILNLTPAGRKTLAEVRATTNEKERLEKLRTGLKGRLDDEWLAVGKLGPRARRAFFIDLLRQDNLTTEEAEFDLNRANIAKLAAAKKADGADWHSERGGQNFDNAINELIAEKKNPKPRKSKAGPKPEEVKAVLETLKSKAARNVLQWEEGVEGAGKQRALDADAAAYRYEQIEATFLKLRDGIKAGPTKDILAYIFGNGDALTIDREFAKLA